MEITEMCDVETSKIHRSFNQKDPDYNWTRMYSVTEVLNAATIKPTVAEPKKNILRSMFSTIANNLIGVMRAPSVLINNLSNFNNALSVTVVENEGIISPEFFNSLTRGDSQDSSTFFKTMPSAPCKESLSCFNDIIYDDDILISCPTIDTKFDTEKSVVAGAELSFTSCDSTIHLKDIMTVVPTIVPVETFDEKVICVDSSILPTTQRTTVEVKTIPEITNGLRDNEIEHKSVLEGEKLDSNKGSESIEIKKDLRQHTSEHEHIESAELTDTFKEAGETSKLLPLILDEPKQKSYPPSISFEIVIKPNKISPRRFKINGTTQSKPFMDIVVKKCEFRDRLLSESSVDSDDSFSIVFQSENGDEEEEEDEEDEEEIEDEEGENSESENEYEAENNDINDFDFEKEDLEDTTHECERISKVRFNPDVEVHRIVAWDYAHRAARVGNWEQAARDRDRFRGRIKNAGEMLNSILNKNHRESIWKERFQ